LKLFVVAVGAAFACAAFMSATAFALATPENLPESTKRTFNGEKVAGSGEAELIAGKTAVTCKNATSEGTEESSKPPKGTFHIDFKECKSAGTTCTGEGEAAGVILSLGTWELIWDTLKPEVRFELTTGILFKLNPETKFSCAAGLVRVVVKGEVICLHLNPTTKSTLHEFHCLSTKEGRQEDTWCMKDEREKCEEALKPLLLSSVSGGAFIESGELALGLILSLLEGRNTEIVADV
jgi:hypothetical protein